MDATELRRRWAAAREVIRDVVGRQSQHDPSVWERGVYQLWLWLVVERLVVSRDEMGVDELSAISRMLHDQRKLSLDEAKRREKPAEGSGHTAGSGRLPDHFDEIVRQIYVANLQRDSAAEVNAANDASSG